MCSRLTEQRQWLGQPWLAASIVNQPILAPTSMAIWLAVPQPPGGMKAQGNRFSGCASQDDVVHVLDRTATSVGPSEHIDREDGRWQVPPAEVQHLLREAVPSRMDQHVANEMATERSIATRLKDSPAQRGGRSEDPAPAAGRKTQTLPGRHARTRTQVAVDIERSGVPEN